LHNSIRFFNLYGIVGQITHNPRSSMLSIAVFFVLGIFILTRVDVDKGSQLAASEEASIALNPLTGPPPL
jgi:MFS-type transporter involved in bile tolerance (Atg22 family)